MTVTAPIVVKIHDPLSPSARLGLTQGSDLLVISIDQVEEFADSIKETARRVRLAREAFNV